MKRPNIPSIFSKSLHELICWWVTYLWDFRFSWRWVWRHISGFWRQPSKMDTACFTENFVPTYESKRRKNPEEHLQWISWYLKVDKSYLLSRFNSFWPVKFRIVNTMMDCSDNLCGSLDEGAVRRRASTYTRQRNRQKHAHILCP
jgi:hypothetical protein